MKRLIPAVFAILLTGCAYVHTHTWERQPNRPPFPITQTNGACVVETSVTAFALFDAQTVMQKMVVRGRTVQTNEYSPGTYIGGLNEAASGTNFNDLLGTVVGAAVKAAKTP
jgi:hypothetical protein